MKKVISVIAASMMAAISLAFGSVSAANISTDNEYTISTKTVETDIIVDKTTVPEGSLAVTISISNNTGFSSSSTKINLSNAHDAILDENGMLVIESGNAIGDSCISGSAGDDCVVIATASGTDKVCDGAMFTFFVANDSYLNDIKLEIAETSLSNVASVNANAVIPMGSSQKFYKIGDVNDDDLIDARDATWVLSALDSTGRESLPYSEVEAFPEFYFPQIYDFNSAFIWEVKNAQTGKTEKLDIDKKYTADIILDYYSCRATNKPYVYEPQDNNDTEHIKNNLKIGFVRPSSVIK